MSGFRVGQLDRRVFVEEPPDPTDADNITEAGEVSGDWTKFATKWAAIEPLTGRELFQAQQVQSEVTHRVRMWHEAGITTDMRLRIDGTNPARYLNILHVMSPLERKQELELLCKEKV